MSNLIKYFVGYSLLLVAQLGVAQEVPYFDNYVVDEANILSNETIQELNAQLQDHNQRTTNQVAVLTIPSLDGGDIDDFATRTYETWNLGSGDLSNGILLTIVPNDRKINIRVGYPLEPYMTDAYAGRIIREVIAPYFREGDYNAGVTAGVRAILEKIEGISELSEREVVEQDRGFSITTILLGIISAFAGFFIIKKRRRNSPRKSKKTGLEMRKLSEKEEDVHLDRGQQIEEKIGSVDYDVWVSDQPDDVSIIAYKSTFNHRYSKCPNCGYITYYLTKSQVLRSATYSHTGEGLRKYACKNCDHTDSRRYHIPRLRRSRTVIIPGGGSYGGGGWSGGGGFSGGGGGGFSGGGFSGGGFGTGGGGASGGW